MDQDVECARMLAAIRSESAVSDIAFAKALRTANVDGSAAGLGRLDAVLAAVKGRFQSPQAITQSRPAMQFARGVAVLLGDAISQALECDVHWYSQQAAQALVPPEAGNFPDAFATQLVGIVSDCMCLPLAHVQSALFDDTPATCATYVNAFVARVRAWPTEENQWAALYLRSLQEDVALPGGLALQDEVRSLGLDWSAQSLVRLDAWLASLRSRPGFRTEGELGEPDVLNLQLLLAYYLAGATARIGGRALKWLTHEEITAQLPDLPLSLQTSRGCLIDGAFWMPLAEIVGRLRDPTEWSCEDFARRVLANPRRNQAVPVRCPPDDAPLPAQPGWPANWTAAFGAVGSMAALSIFMVKPGHSLQPTLAKPNAQGGLNQTTLMFDDVNAAIDSGLARIADDDGSAPFQLLAYDSYANLPQGRLDAITIELRCYGDEPIALAVTVPYRPANGGQAFTVHTPRLIECSQPGFDVPAFAHWLHQGAQRMSFHDFSWRMELDETV